MTTRVLVTGATGAIGLTLVDTLLANGYAVRAFVRNSSDISKLPHDVTIFRGDITSRSALRQACRGCRFVFHLAAMLHINNPSPELHAQYRAINVDGTSAVVESAQHAQVERVLFFSTINVYGPSNGAPPWTENSPLVGSSLYAQTKIEAERMTLSAENHNNQPLCVVLRLAAVYGPHMKGNYQRLLKSVAKRRFISIGSGTNRRTLVYDSDVAHAALLAATTPHAAGQVYNITDGHLHSFSTILAAMYRACALTPPSFSMPISPLRSILTATTHLLRLFRLSSPISPEQLNKLVEDVAVSGSKAIEELGYAPNTSLEDGWRQIVTHLNT